MKLLAALLLIGLAACVRNPAPKGAEVRYEFHGVVKRVDKEAQIATIRHEPVLTSEGKVHMESMTMEFPVRDARALAEMKPGQKIRATLHQIDSNYETWLGEIVIESSSSESPGRGTSQ